MTPENYAYITLAFVSFVLVLIPFPWHLEAWNTGTCLYMFWTALACLCGGINAIIWRDRAIDWAPVWCDISSRVIVAVAVALPASSLCINRRLYHIASVKSVTVTDTAKRRAVLVDLCIGVGIPVLQLVCQYITAGHRYDIYEEIGCFPATYHNTLAYPLVYVWPMAIGLVSAVYCYLTIRAFAKRRSQFKQLLSANKNLNPNRYFRLMALAGVELLCTIPLGAWIIYHASQIKPNPWVSWADTHYNFSRVVAHPAILWRGQHRTVVGLELGRWLVVACGLIFFGFFGFADEARKHYRLAYYAIARRLGLPNLPNASSSSLEFSHGSRPKPPPMSSVNSARDSQISISMPTFRPLDPVLKKSSAYFSMSSFSRLLDKQPSFMEVEDRGSLATSAAALSGATGDAAVERASVTSGGGGGVGGESICESSISCAKQVQEAEPISNRVSIVSVMSIGSASVCESMNTCKVGNPKE